MEKLFDWTDFYTEFADKLLNFKNDRQALIENIIGVYKRLDRNLPKMERNGIPRDIDPFTVFGLFNKGITLENRISLLDEIKRAFAVEASVPTSFDGIPVLNNMKSLFYGFEPNRGQNDIDNLWEVFDSAIVLAAEDTSECRARFSEYYNRVLSQYGVRWNITMGLFWIRPERYISLDARNQWFLKKSEVFGEELSSSINKLSRVPDAEEYLRICDLCHSVLNDTMKSFPELSHAAWDETDSVKREFGTLENALGDVETEAIENNGKYSDESVYTRDDFLEQVYMEEEDYDRLRQVVARKKNVVLQGPPGVGKTFLAKRLAYSMMGVRDPGRVMMIQFHQSYSYEDFIEGFRPNENGGFDLIKGSFLTFCEKAKCEEESGKEFFFIIDEINRGNLSRIFGELFMLIEEDKRGERNQLPLLYSRDSFYVPQNVYIIGLMNTADRSLAVLDYALRRRFAFFDIKPGFESIGFGNYEDELDYPAFDRLVDYVESLNEIIKKDLGDGFCIGHSYLCNIAPKNISKALLKDIVDYEIGQLLREYWYDEKDKAEGHIEKLHKEINDAPESYNDLPRKRARVKASVKKKATRIVVAKRSKNTDTKG